MLTINPNISTEPVPTFLSDEEVSNRINTAVAAGKAARRQQVYVDLDLGHDFSGSPERELFRAKITMGLKEAGFEGTSWDGRTSNLIIPLKRDRS